MRTVASPPASAGGEAVLDALRAVLGDEHVITDETTRVTYETATYHTRHRIPAIVRPGTTAEVQACVRIANQFKAPLYPISTGKNFGYGSRVPAADGCIVLELSRMNRILDFNEELGYVTLEPGVTQQQLYDFLQARQSRLWMDATGSTPHHGIIGNLAERGFGHTPYGDHFGNLGGLEVVLPNGDCLHPGLGRFANAEARGLYRWGLGPYVDGLFTQSNLGIITQATIWLMPAPECHEYFYFSVDRQDGIGEIIDLLRPLRLDGTIRGAIHIANDYKVISSIHAYPWQQAKGRTPLPRAVLDESAGNWNFGAWNGYSALYGTRREVASARRRLRAQLRGKVKKLAFLGDARLRLLERLSKPYQWLTGVDLGQMLKILRPVYLLTKGVPSEDFLASTYWRKPDAAPSPADPDRDGCGLLWCAPIAPMAGQHAAAIHRIVEPIFARHCFEPMLSITLLTERAMSCVIGIAFDREVPGEDRKALACHDQLLAELTAAGYYPYRLSTHAMDKLPMPEPAYSTFLQRIKEALDPNGILAPGRYDR